MKDSYDKMVWPVGVVMQTYLGLCRHGRFQHLTDHTIVVTQVLNSNKTNNNKNNEVQSSINNTLSSIPSSPTNQQGRERAAATLPLTTNRTLHMLTLSPAPLTYLQEVIVDFEWQDGHYVVLDLEPDGWSLSLPILACCRASPG